MKINYQSLEKKIDLKFKNKKITKIIQKNFKIKNFKYFLSISDEKNYSTAFAIIQTS